MLDTAHLTKGWAVLVELSVMEQWYQAVLAVFQDGWKVTEVAERLGVSRQSVHAWIAARRPAASRPWLTVPTGRPPAPTRPTPGPRRRSASSAESIQGGGRGTSSLVPVSRPPRPARPSTGAYAATA